MNGMEFSSNVITVLVWPLVVLFVLIVYRNWITSTITTATRDRQLKKFRLGPVEVEWFLKIDTAGKDVGDALKEMPDPLSDEPVPVSLVDLIDDINDNPRTGIRKAFRVVRRALDESYPELASVPQDRLPDALRDLVRRGVLHAEVESAISQLQKLLDMSDSDADMAGPAWGYQFLILAEGAIHGILRSAKLHADELNNARPASELTPIRSSWRGWYNRDFLIELRIDEWSNSTGFKGVMNYPGSGTATRIAGHITTKEQEPGRATVAWQEEDYVSKGSRTIDFRGEYKATVSGNIMTGAWWKNEQLIAEFQLEAA